MPSKKKIQEGTVLMFWITASLVLLLIALAVYLIWQVKLALLLAAVLGIIFIFWITVFYFWIKQFKKIN
ncbi:hypothetical protein [Carnobacterium maltaromaticum]|uniref:hypothetical protein n=1 Tax=Carnobacterium maltaromaticum TaxID=2751 RepID=UPI00026C8A82|nr:hypothetical protein [Carnobacterium maltaromaticum]